MQPIINVLGHHFYGGIYAKECVIQEGFAVKQHAHNFDHMSFLAEGCAIVWRGEEQETYYAPKIIEMPAGIEHAVEAVNGHAIWYCLHATNEIDETKIDDVLIQKKTANMHDTGWTIDVSELNGQLESHPKLWNQHTLRTESPDSPHHGCDDIWVRFNDLKNYDPNNPQAFHDIHESVWYYKYHKSMFGLVLRISHIIGKLEAYISNPVGYNNPLNFDKFGGILITRIPAGGKVLRHNDAGRWHAEHYKDKYLIPLKCNDKQAFCFDGERHVTEVGHIYKFNNLEDHWVGSASDEDRISLIICMRHD